MIENLAHSIKKNYQFDISNIEFIQDGSDNIVLKALRAKDKNIVIRISKRNKSDKAFEQEAEILEFLAGEGIPVPQYLKTIQGSYFAFLSENKYMCSKFIQGQQGTLKEKPNDDLVLSAAYTLAKLHRTKLDLKKLYFERTIFTEIDRLKEKRAFFKLVYQEAEDFIKIVALYSNRIQERSVNEAIGFLHNDYRIHNVLIENNQIVAVLDFDWSTIGPYKKDLAHSILEWSFPDGATAPWKDVARLFFKSYLKLMPAITPDDLKDWIIYAALSDACTYYIDRIPGEGIQVKKKMQSYMHRKALYFHEMSEEDFLDFIGEGRI